MYLYKIEGKIVKSSVPLPGKTPIPIDYYSLTSDEQAFMIDVSNGVVIIDTERRDAAILERLQIARSKKIAALDEIYEARLSSNVSAKGKSFACSAGDRQNMRDALNIINSGANAMQWRATDGESVLFTGAEYISMVQSLFARGHALNNAHHVHKVALEALTDIGQIESYDVSVGWPGQ